MRMRDTGVCRVHRFPCTSTLLPTALMCWVRQGYYDISMCISWGVHLQDSSLTFHKGADHRHRFLAPRWGIHQSPQHLEGWGWSTMSEQPAWLKTKPSTNQGGKHAHFCSYQGVLTELPDTTQHNVSLGFQLNKKSFSSINMTMPLDNTWSHLGGETRGSGEYFLSLFLYPKLNELYPLPRTQKQMDGTLVTIFPFFQD